MVADFILIVLKFIIVIVFAPFKLITVSLDGFYTALHWFELYLFMFWHIFFLDVVLSFFLAMLLFEGGIFAITALMRARGWITGSQSL